MVNGMEILREQEHKLPGNKEACKRYYEKNAKNAKRRVVVNEISRFGRIPKEETLEKWDISIHDVIFAFRKYRQERTPEELEKKLLKFRILVGNML